MSDERETSEREPVPPMQRLFDRPFVLLVAGMIVMFAFYTVWGVVEVMSLPKAALP